MLDTTHIEKNWEPPYGCPSAVGAPGPWCAPALPMTCSADSAKRSRPEAPIGLELSTPPDGLTDSLPPMAVSPANFAAPDLAGLVPTIKRKLKKIQYRPHLIDGCLARTGLTTEPW
jgi:hypothetical protein